MDAKFGGEDTDMHGAVGLAPLLLRRDASLWLLLLLFFAASPCMFAFTCAPRCPCFIPLAHIGRGGEAR